ncbi:MULTISPECIES: APC family permease [Lactobacillus]|uniref:APC family permease n=1 Tax=Lactobacillus xujianguonis TaxID=2495899 RepID=A0A437SY64_9LACO|nr:MULTISPECIES: APC family permease [Lactobacillus]RVU71853.1 APC family permease [Lactobacillus xujianguonis]RVU77629.1 APC family permease [Lactobacillus xujianguonis]
MKTQKKNTNSIGVIGATAIGVGGMMGAGLYTLLGLAAKSAGVWLPLSFLIGGLVAAFSVYSYSKLGMKYPDRGGAAKFLLKGFGDGLLAGGLNVFQYLGWVVAMALYATGFSEYVCQFAHQNSNSWFGKAVSVAIVIVVVFINILGSKQVARAQTTIITFELIILIAFIAIGLTEAHVPTINSSNAGSGIVGILSAAGLLYVTYEGFGVVTNAAGNMKNPKKQLPLALFLSLGIVMMIYIIASFVVISTIGVKAAVANQGHVLAAAGQAVFGQIGMILIGIAALVATASAVNSTMFGDENLGLRIAKVDEIPPKFGSMTHFGGTWGLFFTSFLVCLFVIIFPLSSVGEMASLSFLLVYAMVNVGHLRLVKETCAKKSILIIAVILNLALFALLFAQTIMNGETLTWIAVIFPLVISFVIEFVWRKKNKQNLNWLGK